MRIVFIGGVEIGLTVFKAVFESGYPVHTLFTLPLEAAAETSGFVDFEPFALERGTRVIRTKNINQDKMVQEIRDAGPDIIIVCGWQRLVCKEILTIPKLGCIGFHSSLLPKYRGRAPVNWAMVMGERETGITMFYLTPEADTGDIIAKKAFPILFNDDCGSVYKKSAQAGAALIAEYLPRIEKDIAPRIHNEARSYPAYPKRTPEDGLIDFNRSALDVYNFVRALTRPYPGAFYYDTQGRKVKVWRAEIVFDDNRTHTDDIVFDTKDFKIRLVDWEFD